MALFKISFRMSLHGTCNGSQYDGSSPYGPHFRFQCWLCTPYLSFGYRNDASKVSVIISLNSAFWHIIVFSGLISFIFIYLLHSTQCLAVVNTFGALFGFLNNKTYFDLGMSRCFQSVCWLSGIDASAMNCAFTSLF